MPLIPDAVIPLKLIIIPYMMLGVIARFVTLVFYYFGVIARFVIVRCNYFGVIARFVEACIFVLPVFLMHWRLGIGLFLGSGSSMDPWVGDPRGHWGHDRRSWEKPIPDCIACSLYS